MTDNLFSESSLVPPAIDTIPINFAILDSEGVILWTNRAWQEFGEANDIASRPDTIGVNYLDITKTAEEQSAQETADGLAAVLSGEKDLFELEYPCHSPDEERWFLLRAARFTYADELYVAVAHIDITARKLKEKRLERAQQIIETAGQVVFVTDRDGTITYVNPAFEKVTGYTAEEALGRTPRILKSGEHDATFYEDMWETILADESWNGTIINRRKTGDLFYVQASIEPVTDDDGRVEKFVAVQTDITDIEEMRQLLQRHDEIMRHDLRTQLNLILIHAEELKDDTEANSNHTRAIFEAVEQLLSTTEKTRQLREFLERTTEPTVVDLATIAATAVKRLREHYPDARIELNAPEKAYVQGLQEIETALVEVIDNSIVHTDQPEPQVSVSIHEEAGDWALTIEDTGPGIPEMEYEWFDTAQSTPTAHKKGIGLDLAYWITRRSGGRLVIEPRTAGGTRVKIILPQTGHN